MNDRIILTPSARRRLLVAAVTLVCVVALGAINVAYTSHVQHVNDRRWCQLLGEYVTAYREQPPETELGKRISFELERLWRLFGCA